MTTLDITSDWNQCAGKLMQKYGQPPDASLALPRVEEDPLEHFDHPITPTEEGVRPVEDDF